MAQGDFNKDSIQEDIAKNPLGVTCDEDGDINVRVCVVIPGIKKKFGKNAMANGNLDVKYRQRSIDLKVNVITKEKGETKFDCYKYNVKRLPDEILPEQCRHKIKKDQVVLYIAKAKPRSWASDLDRTGLETYKGEEDELE